MASGALTPIAGAADLPGAPKIAKHKDAKVKAVNAQGAKAAREAVAKTQAENKAQADRARTEAKANWPKAATLGQSGSAARSGSGLVYTSDDQASLERRELRMRSRDRPPAHARWATGPARPPGAAAHR
ncbi:hypothetical protein [Streptomyces sp. ICC4]|uniref:hypothetical protein n=1 Tax=Streptomyces sp. ICC4 TaxID=2099584 RepID=UPI001EF917A2|nr:hypothetical protein [Streptomyces sp. ICC4]